MKHRRDAEHNAPMVRSTMYSDGRRIVCGWFTTAYVRARIRGMGVAT